MFTEIVPWYRLAARYVPLDSLYDGFKIGSQQRSQTKHMRHPANCDGKLLQYMRKNRYPERTTLFIEWRDSPRDKRRPAGISADFEVVADSVDPLTKMTLVNPAAQVTHFVF